MVVIAKGAPVNAVIKVNNQVKAPKSQHVSHSYSVSSGKFVSARDTKQIDGELTINLISAQAVDGTDVELEFCVLQRFPTYNGYYGLKEKILLVPGTLSNCATTRKVTVKFP